MTLMAEPLASVPVITIPVRTVPTLFSRVTVVELEVAAFTVAEAWSSGVTSLYSPPDST